MEKLIISVHRRTRPVDCDVEEETTRMYFAVPPCGVIGDGIELQVRPPETESGTGMNPRICTARQLDATAGDGLLGSAGSPGRLETSLYSSYPP